VSAHRETPALIDLPFNPVRLGERIRVKADYESCNAEQSRDADEGWHLHFLVSLPSSYVHIDDRVTVL
jgi:hypothetical protein